MDKWDGPALESTSRLGKPGKKHSLHESQSLGAKVNWVNERFGGPLDVHIWKIIGLLIAAWITAYASAFTILEYVLFTADDNDKGKDRADSTVSATSSTDEIASSLGTTDTFWAAQMDLTDFATFVSFLSSIAVVMTGIGLEIFMWRHWLVQGWDAKVEVKWRLAQFLFPLFGFTSLGMALHQEYFSLVVAVV